MAKLINAYRDILAKDKDKSLAEESKVFYTFKTGFNIIDYRNGKRIHTDEGDSFDSLGINEGTYILLVGPSGSGKTTLAIQMAVNITNPYEEALIIHDDIEQATDLPRFKTLSGWSTKKIKEKWIHKTVGITSESVFKRIRKLANLKLEMEKEMKIKTEREDENGNPIYILPPTVYIIDSLALLSPETVTTEEELSGNMSTTASARVNASVFRRILPYLKKANIILMVVNHITEKVDINPMAKSKAQVNYLKQNESIPGKQLLLGYVVMHRKQLS